MNFESFALLNSVGSSSLFNLQPSFFNSVGSSILAFTNVNLQPPLSESQMIHVHSVYFGPLMSHSQYNIGRGLIKLHFSNVITLYFFF